MRILNFLFVLLLVSCPFGRAGAQLLPPLLPEQDACHAIKICGNFFSPYSYTGYGSKLELSQLNGACFDEGHSIWLWFEIATPGIVVFTITPVNTGNDYDFAVFNMTNTPCDSVSMQQMVRCESVDINTSPGGLTGLADTAQLTTSGPNSGIPPGTGQPFVAALNAVAGEKYYLLIDNFQAPWFNPALSGFGIDFTGSTAVFVGDGNPKMDSLHIDKCNQLTLFLDKSVKCSSIAADGSDFILSPHSANTLSAVGANCISNGYTQSITLAFDGGLPTGSYALKAQTGTDGNTLLGICNEPLLLPDSLMAVGLQLSAGPDDTIIGCQLSPHALAGSMSNTMPGLTYSISWSPASSIISGGNGLTPTVNPVNGTVDYILTVSLPAAQGNCIWTDSVLFTYGDSSVSASFATTDTVCTGTSIAIINTSSGSIDACTWSFGDGTVDTAYSPVHTFEEAGIHDIILVVANSICRDTADGLALVKPVAPYLEFHVSDTALCEGKAIYFTADTSTGDPNFLQWDFGDGSVIPFQQIVQHAFDSAGIFTIGLKPIPGACNDTIFQKRVTINPFPGLDLGPDTTMCLNGSPVTLGDYKQQYKPGTTWKWNTGDTTRMILARHPGIYTTEVTEQGCSTSDSIEIFKDCYIDVPNSFTPNGDGTNDYFFPREILSKSLTGFKMSIFNRWGQVIFQTDKIDGRGWDGKFNNTDQPNGVYIYLIEAIIKNDKREQYKGNVTLLR